MDRTDRTPLFPGNGARLGSVLLDGRFAGGWRIERQAARAVLAVELRVQPSRPDRAALVEEGLGLLRFAAGDDSRNEVVFARNA
jgi:hypothetical protein